MDAQGRWGRPSDGDPVDVGVEPVPRSRTRQLTGVEILEVEGGDLGAAQLGAVGQRQEDAERSRPGARLAARGPNGRHHALLVVNYYLASHSFKLVALDVEDLVE